MLVLGWVVRGIWDNVVCEGRFLVYGGYPFDIVVFDYIPFPIFTHTTGMTHFLASRVQLQTAQHSSHNKSLTIK